MGYWKLTAWRLVAGKETDELTEADKQHIAKCIEEGYVAGEVQDNEEEGD